MEATVDLEVNVDKEKEISKKMLQVVEEGLEQQKVKKERKQKKHGDRVVCPSNNWNMLRKQIKEHDEKVKKGEIKDEDGTSKSKKKKNKKRKQKETNKGGNSKQNEVKGASIVDLVFYPDKHGKSKGDTPIVGLDCEMVEVDDTSDGLARVSIVNYNGHILMDTFVKPKGNITNYRTWVSGVTPEHMENAMSYDEAREKALSILKGKIIIGHSLKHDFKSLNWEPLQQNVRDLITFKKYQDETNHPKSLKKLTLEFLEKTIQTGQHSSITDSRAALALYRIVENSWNQQVRAKQNKLKRVRVEAEVNIFGQKHKKRKKLKE